MKQLTLLIFNTLALIGALVVNGLSGSDVFDGVSVSDISARYDTPISPAGYAFAIWGIIYLGLISFVAYQWYAWLKHRDDSPVRQTGIWFIVAKLANALWMVVWLNGMIGLSVLMIFALLGSLMVLTFRLRLEVWDAPLRIIAFVWWPICFYVGWIIAASVINVSVYLASTGWQGGPLSPATWAVIMIALATAIYLLITFTRNMREAAVVGVWAFIGIAVRQWQAHQEVGYAALAGAAVLLGVIS